MTRVEHIVGEINGVNRRFSTSKPYVAGSLSVFLPMLTPKGSLTELGGVDFELATPPRPGDLIYVFYQVQT